MPSNFDFEGILKNTDEEKIQRNYKFHKNWCGFNSNFYFFFNFVFCKKIEFLRRYYLFIFHCACLHTPAALHGSMLLHILII